jgi:hypothetical protein
VGLLTLLNAPGQGTNTSDMPDLYLEWSPTTGPRETPVWERIPLSDIRQIDINRGRNRELDRFQAGRMSVVLDNRLRRYDPQLGAQAQYIDFPGTSGNYASTPDSAAVSITGDIDIRVRVALDDWTPAAVQSLIMKEFVGARSYGMNVGTTGALRIRYSIDGTNALEFGSSATVSFTNGQTAWVRATRVASTGVARFFTSTDATNDPDAVVWTQLGTDVATTAGNIADTTSDLHFGARVAGGTADVLAGNVYYAEVRNGINGPVVAKFDPNTVPQQATRIPNTWVADTTGETWTINGSAWAWGGTWGTPWSGNIKPMRRIRLRAIWDTTYDLFSGFVDSWDQEYDHTNEATCVVTATDGFKVLSEAGTPSSAYAEEIRSDTPTAWYRLNEGTGSTTFVDASGNGHNLTITGTPTFGTASLNEFDSDTAVTLSTTAGASRNTPIITSGSFTVEFLYKRTVEEGQTLIVGQADQINGAGFEVDTDSTDNFFFAVSTTTGFLANVTSNTTIVVGTLYHVVCVWEPNGQLTIYVNGEDDTAIADTTFPSLPADQTWTGSVLLGAGELSGVTVPGPQAVVDEVAVYNYPFTADDVTSHYEAIIAPWNGDTTGQRIGRLLDAIGWPATDRDVDTGDSTLQSAELGTSALEHAQLVRDTEFGELFMLPDGRVRFVGRQNKWKPPYNDPVATFSDDGSDLGYGRLKFNYDDQLIRNRVTIGYDNGITYTANSTGSQDDFFIKSYDKTGLIGDVDSEAVDYANYVVGRYDEPLLRVQGISVTPQRDPDVMWPEVLGLDLVYQVNVERTPQGVGSVIDLDYTIEGVAHHIEPRFWRTELQLSPADTPGAFILDSTSQGILDTNTLGW